MSTRSAAIDRPTLPLARSYRSSSLTLRGREFLWGSRTYVMAILNVTPDSFSGDGVAGDIPAAVALAKEFEAAGADIIDIGAASTRPGAPELPADHELARLLPVLEAVRAATDLPISVDTYHATVAVRALEEGAHAVNDIWGLRHDHEMAPVVARHGAVLFAMHNQRGRAPVDVIEGASRGFAATLALAEAAGIPTERIILDPGFGFGWTPEQNLELIRRLPELWHFGQPLLLGTSRKSTIGFVLGAPVEERREGTAASVALAVAAGADIVRVHDVAEMARVVKVADAIVRANWQHKS